MTGRWRVERHTDRRGRPLWKVHDGQDRGRPVAEFRDEEAANAHAERLAQGPFDLDEQEAWQDEDDEDEPTSE